MFFISLVSDIDDLFCFVFDIFFDIFLVFVLVSRVMAPSRNCFIGDSLIPRIARLRKIWIASLIWSGILSQPGARSLLFRNMPEHDAYVKMAVAHAKVGF